MSERGSRALPPAPWTARLFGPLRLSTPTGEPATPPGRKARALLAYLILTEEPAPRDRLAGLLWGDRGPDQARASVRQALYELRALADESLLRIDRGEVQANPGRLRTDLDELRELAVGADAAALADLLGETPQALLSDLDDLDAGFDDWLAGERARRAEERQALGLAVAGRALAVGDAVGAAPLAAALLAADPYDERAVRLALEARAALGDRAGARQVFRRYARAVREDLGIEPSADLVAMDVAIGTEAPRPRSRPDPAPAAPEPMARPLRSGRPRLWAVVALVAVVAAVCGGLAWRRWTERPRVLRVDALSAPAADAPAQALRVGFSADLARVVLGNDARLVVKGPSEPPEGGPGRTDYVIAGEARSGDGLLRANLRLLDAASGAILWSRSFARAAAEADALRGQIADAAADVAICAEGGHRPPPRDMDVETLRLYLEGCEQKHGDWKTAARLLGEAVRRRPDFAHGWAMLAAATGAVAPDGPQGAQMRGQAEAYARRALALDPDEGEAWDARAEALPGPGLWAQRMAMLNEGHRRDPDNSIVNIDLATDLADVGRRSEALGFAQSAMEHDPFNRVIASQVIRLLGLYGQPLDAQSLATESGRRWPADPWIAEAWFRVLALSGDPRAASRLLDPPGPSFDISAAEVTAWQAVLTYRQTGSVGDRAAAESAVRAMRGDGDPAASVVGVIDYTLLDDLDGAYAEANRFPDRSFPARWVLFYAAMAPFRADPRFMGFAARQGLVDDWRQTGRWPDFCLAPNRPYDCAKAVGAKS